MAVSMQKARDYVYANGVLWERALFAHLFQDAPIERLHQCVACYRNADGGFGHALEHDARTPDSHPLALEYILGVFAQYDLDTGGLFDGAAAWVAANTADDGSLRNPPSFLAYPHAPWWNAGGQTAPDSIAGLLNRFGKATPGILETSQQWVAEHLTLEKIKANEWLFMAYHAVNYFWNVEHVPQLEAHQQATIENIRACLKELPTDQLYTVFQLVPTPGSPLAAHLPQEIIERGLEHLGQSQQTDGGWPDQHGLTHWYPAVTISNLYALRSFGRL